MHTRLGSSSSSSCMCVINHNWSATKQHLRQQSVAEISCHSVLSWDWIRQCETISGSRHKDTDQWKPWERCRTEGTRDKTHGRVQLHIDLTCVSSTLLLNSKAPEQMTAVLALATQVEPASKCKCSFINKLFRFFSLPAVFVKCTL